MEDMKYYRQLIQQGYPPMAAAQYTKQYFPEFQDPILNPSLFISPDANSIPQPSVQNPIGIGLPMNGLESSLNANSDEKSSRKKIFIASILILGLVGTAFFYAYDPYTEPEFYDEILWDYSGIGILFEEDSIYYVNPPYNGTYVDEPTCMFDSEEFKGEGASNYEIRDGLCYWEWNIPPDNYSIEPSSEGDYHNFCMISSYDESEICSKIYSAEKGVIFEYNGNCSTRVSDISPPEETYITWYDGNRDDWQMEVDRIADEIGKEVPASCTYIPSYGAGGNQINFQPANRDELNTAILEWMYDSDSASSTYGDINTWNTSLITDMSGLFYSVQSGSPFSFNCDISEWDVSSVTDMSEMFKEADSFNCDISEWDVSSVTDMSGMFERAERFNQDISDWDVSSVTDMNRMFDHAGSFNQDISEWDVSSVTDMNRMFDHAGSFNQDISEWDVSSVTDMNSMFNDARSFNQDISDWDVSAVTDMAFMFVYAQNFDQDISEWNVSSVTNMALMFASSSFNQDISDWDVSAVTDMALMFASSSFNQDISDWDVSSVTKMDEMFGNAEVLSGNNKCAIHTSFSSNNEWEYHWEPYCIQINMEDCQTDTGDSQINFQPGNRDELKTAVDEWMYDCDNANSTYGHINTWNTSLIIDMSGLFHSYNYNIYGYQFFNCEISDWDVSSVTDMNRMFDHAGSFNQDISEWDVSSVTDMNSMFDDARSFNQDISEWDVSNVTDMRAMFTRSSFNQDISDWDVSNVTEMGAMFAVTSFNQDISDWDVSSVNDMKEMFDDAGSFNQDISEWDVSSVTDMNSMFDGAGSFNQDISEWDVSNVTDMRAMFTRSSFNQDISDWDVSSVNDMGDMFYYAESFNQDISDWNVSSVTKMKGMFAGTSFNQDISEWDVSSVTKMDMMFAGTSFNQDLSDWDVSSVTDMSAMFEVCGEFQSRFIRLGCFKCN